MVKKKWITHRAKSRRYRKRAWRQRHKATQKNFGSSPNQGPLTPRKQLAREFFTKRFGRSPESDPLYFEEWEKRINTYDTNFLKGTADSESMKILRDVKKKYPSVDIPGLKSQ